MEQVNQRVVDVVGHGTAYDEFKDRKQLSELVVGVRIDDLPEVEIKRLAGAGRLYPLTTDADGNLRVALREGSKVEINDMLVYLLHDIRAAVRETNELLQRIAPA